MERSISASTSTTAKCRTSRSFASRRTTSSSSRSDVRTLTDEQLGGYGRDLIDQRDNMGAHGSVTYIWGNHQVKGGLDWQRHDNFRDTLYIDSALYESVSSRYSPGGVISVERVDWVLESPGVRRQQHERLRRPDRDDQRPARPCAVLRGFRCRRQRDDHRGRAGHAADLQQHGRKPECDAQLRPDVAVLDWCTGNLLEGPQLLRSGSVHRWPAADLQCGSPRRAVVALRDDGREHLHVPLGIRAAAERRLRPARKRPPQGLGVLGTLFRSDPKRHDELRGHAHGLRPRGTDVHARRMGHVPHPRRRDRSGRASSRRRRRRRTPTTSSSATPSISDAA